MDAYGGREGWCMVHGEPSGLAFYTPDNVVDGMEDVILRNPWNRPPIFIRNFIQYASLRKLQYSILKPNDFPEARPSTSLRHIELVVLEVFKSDSLAAWTASRSQLRYPRSFSAPLRSFASS